MLAVIILRRGQQEKWKIGGALLLTLAICSHHFTAMAAVSIIPDQAIEVSQSALPAGLFAMGVTIASFAILGLALASCSISATSAVRSLKSIGCATSRMPPWRGFWFATEKPSFPSTPVFPY